ncbi:MAG: hypothetical protein NVSMB9_06930 [Isosphaeraceae bacterium]
MATIRRELHEDVRGVVASAEAATDWKRYITAYPWLSIGVALAAGYLIVPRKRTVETALEGVATKADLSKIRETVEKTKQEIVETANAKISPSTQKKGLVAVALGMVAPYAMRAVQGYALKYLEQWIAQQQMNYMPGGPSPLFSPPPGSSGPGRQPGTHRTGGPREF